MMSLIHSQVPWYAALPIAAFLTRGVLVTTAGSWARSLTARYIGLQPLRQALAYRKRDEITKQGGFRSPKEAMVTLKKEVKNEVNKLDKRWNVTLWGQINWTFAQIPIFFTMAEVIRQMSGARDGLLALGLSAFKSGDKSQPQPPIQSQPQPQSRIHGLSRLLRTRACSGSRTYSSQTPLASSPLPSQGSCLPTFTSQTTLSALTRAGPICSERPCSVCPCW
jgi:hypothetical protein